MDLENKFEAQWVSMSENNSMADNKAAKLELLEKELADIQNNIEFIDERRRVLGNLLKLY